MKLKSIFPKFTRPVLRFARAALLSNRAKRRLSKLRGRRKLFFLLSPNLHFPNLGDQAMASVIPGWIAKHYDGIIVEFAFNEDFDVLAVVEKYAVEGDIAFLVSGGNFGDTWPVIQKLREDIFRRLPLVKVIQLPQTIFFSDTQVGQDRLLAMQMAISAHRDVTIVGRDTKSAELARQYFPSAPVLCFPDMALLLDPIVQAKISPSLTSRPISRVLAILRSDREGVLGDEQKMRIQTDLHGMEVVYWDTDPVEDVFQKSERIEVLLKYLRFIASFDAVVTDRFHGLIFSLLTRRPCVVLSTHNHKIASALEWFSDVPFVALAPSTDEVPTVLTRVASVDVRTVPDWDVRFFTPMAAALGADK